MLSHHEFGAAEDQRGVQRGWRCLDSRAGRRRKGTTQGLHERGRIRRRHTARFLRLVFDFDAVRSVVSRNDRAYRPAPGRFIFLNGGRSSGRFPEPSAVAKLSRVIIASGLSHASRAFE